MIKSLQIWRVFLHLLPLLSAHLWWKFFETSQNLLFYSFLLSCFFYLFLKFLFSFFIRFFFNHSYISNLWRPSHITLYVIYKYYLSFIDVFFMFTWILLSNLKLKLIRIFNFLTKLHIPSPTPILLWNFHISALNQWLIC